MQGSTVFTLFGDVVRKKCGSRNAEALSAHDLLQKAALLHLLSPGIIVFCILMHSVYHLTVPSDRAGVVLMVTGDYSNASAALDRL